MIDWYKDLYMDSEISKSPEMYMQIAEGGRIDITPVYCIAIASNEANLLDIISSNELYFKHYRRNTIHVIGLAASYRTALELASGILLDVYRKTGAFDIRHYISTEAGAEHAEARTESAGVGENSTEAGAECDG